MPRACRSRTILHPYCGPGPREPSLGWAKSMFYLEHFDLVKFDKDGRVHGKHILTNRLIKTHLDMSGLLNIKSGKLVGFQRRIMWKRVKGQKTILLAQHHCWSRLDKKDEQVINKVYWSWDLLED